MEEGSDVSRGAAGRMAGCVTWGGIERVRSASRDEDERLHTARAWMKS